MAEQLIIRLASLDDDAASWLVLDARGNRIGFPQHGTLATVAPLTSQRRVIVLLPGEDILQLQAAIPGRNRQQIVRAAPFAIEDRIAGNVDDMFVAVLDAGNASKASRFVIIDRDLLDEQLDRLGEHGIKPDAMLPDHSVLPVPEQPGDVHWWIENGRLLARDSQQGFSASLDDVPFLLGRLDDDVTLHVYSTDDTEIPAALQARIDENEAATHAVRDHDRLFTDMAANAVARKDGGLLQQEYKPENHGDRQFRHWRPAAMLALAVLLLGTVNWGLGIYRMQAESDFLDAQMERLFRQAMPGSRYDFATAESQMRARLKGNAGSSDGRLLKLLAAVGQSMNGLDDAQFKGFSFRNGTLEIAVSVKDAQTLETLQNKLRANTSARIQLQSANSDGDRLEGRLLIEGGSA